MCGIAVRDGKMHQTTVRFGSDLWESLEAECARLGVSAAQYVREAALARLAFTAGRRGDAAWLRAFDMAGAGADASLEERTTREPIADARAVFAQAEHARKRAQRLREQSRTVRSEQIVDLAREAEPK